MIKSRSVWKPPHYLDQVPTWDRPENRKTHKALAYLYLELALDVEVEVPYLISGCINANNERSLRSPYPVLLYFSTAVPPYNEAVVEAMAISPPVNASGEKTRRRQRQHTEQTVPRTEQILSSASQSR